MKTLGTFTIVAMFLLSVVSSCTDMGSAVKVSHAISSDDVLFTYITRTDPFVSYPLFPRVDSVTSGTLNGSTAHQPFVRVSLNARALAVLENGSLPNGTMFPDGSVVFKQIIMGGQTVLYAVILKDSQNPLAANGWLWAEYRPDGTTAISVTQHGGGCIGCHSREQGPQHDFVRTFERQR